MHAINLNGLAFQSIINIFLLKESRFTTLGSTTTAITKVSTEVELNLFSH